MHPSLHTLLLVPPLTNLSSLDIVMETKSAASLLLLPLLLQLAVVFAAPVVVQNDNSTSQTCDSSKINDYTGAIFKIRGKIVRSRPRNPCSRLLTSMFPGQTISPTFCRAVRTTIGKYSPLQIPEHRKYCNSTLRLQCLIHFFSP